MDPLWIQYECWQATIKGRSAENRREKVSEVGREGDGMGWDIYTITHARVPIRIAETARPGRDMEGREPQFPKEP